MLIVWGQRIYGRTQRFAGSYVATRFFHIYYVPLIPLSSWLVFREDKNGLVGQSIPLHAGSIIGAWLRTASIVAIPAAFIAATSMSALASRADHASALALLALVTALGVYAWFRHGQLSREDQLARTVYADFSGRFVDVALLRADHAMLREKTIEILDGAVVKHATASYREAPQTDWRVLATRPDMRDVALLKAALTRSRIEWATAKGKARDALATDHATILANLVATNDPSLTIAHA